MRWTENPDVVCVSVTVSQLPYLLFCLFCVVCHYCADKHLNRNQYLLLRLCHLARVPKALLSTYSAQLNQETMSRNEIRREVAKPTLKPRGLHFFLHDYEIVAIQPMRTLVMWRHMLSPAKNRITSSRTISRSMRLQTSELMTRKLWRNVTLRKSD